MSDANAQQRIADNLDRVRAEIEKACVAADRDPQSVRLIGVSKYVDAATTRQLVQAGCRDLGENRPKVLWQKAESGLIDDDIDWHMIGHVQRNKVRRMLRRPVLIHSIDSHRVATTIAKESMAVDRVTDGLLEINISGEDEKTGMTRDQIFELLGAGPIPGLRWRGLMAMASRNDSVGSPSATDGSLPNASVREQFDRVREFRDQLEHRYSIKLPELSMGMSGDFADAIAAGSTMIRIGTALFDGVMNSSPA